MTLPKKMNSLHGWLLLDKPEGISSNDALQKVRRLLKVKKVGHAGTLDPLASGVLPLAIGEATKLIPYIMATEKTYVFDVTWGEQRNTDDREGEPIHQSSKRPTLEDINDILPLFQGTIQQTPPLYSAIKIQGKRACDRMRHAEEVVLTPRPVVVHDLTLVEMTSPHITRFKMRCGKGTYVRSIARDMGIKLGCYGYVSTLRRTAVGPFLEKDGYSLQKLLAFSDTSLVRECIKPMAYALDDILVMAIESHLVNALQKGQSVLIETTSHTDEAVVFVTDMNNTPVGLATLQNKCLKPKRLFNL